MKPATKTILACLLGGLFVAMVRGADKGAFEADTDPGKATPGARPSCLKSADANDDGSVDIADPTRALSDLFGSPSSTPAKRADSAPPAARSAPRSWRSDYHLWVSPDGRGETWTSRTLIAEGGKGYAFVVEAAPGQLVYSGYNKKKTRVATLAS